MSEASTEGGHIRQAWLVILLAVVYGGALAGVQTTLGPRIERNKKNETLSKVPQLVDGAAGRQTAEVDLTGADGRKQTVYRAIAADGKTHVGWVLPAGGQGFADRIEVLIGLSADASTITGLYVLDQKETPGLGNFITDQELFLDQFAGKSADQPLTVVKADPTGNQIRALSGATISSESVAEIVNRAVANYREPIRREAAETGGTRSEDASSETSLH